MTTAAANLDNRLTVGAVALYDALTEEPTAEEEEAMDQLTRARKARSYESQIKLLSTNSPLGLVNQTIEALSWAEKLEAGFNLFFHDAYTRNDFDLMGRLISRSLELYRHKLAAEEVGVK